jgi:D-xylose transport system ATP-binding protein
MPTATTSKSEYALEAHGICKQFPGVRALDGVSFDLRPGEIIAVCGENGAGKSTLIKILSGIIVHGTYEGEVRINGKPLQLRSLKEAEAAGIAVIYQELALISEMTVAENLVLGQEPVRRGRIDWDRVYKYAHDLLDELEMDIDPAAPVGELGVGRQQLVEIAKAVGKRSQILILDEPTAALTEQEVEVLLRILRQLRESGVSAIYISHKLDEVFAIADRILVLRDGKSVSMLETKNTDQNEVIRHMVGREISDLFPRRSTKPGEVKLRVKDLYVEHHGKPVLENINLEVRGGEVVGIGGLMGAGRSELLMHLFGAMGTRTRGSVELEGKPLNAPPHEIIRRGLVLVGEDRKRYGLFLEHPIGFNLSLSSLASVSRYSMLDGDAEFKKNQGFFDALRVKANGLETVVNTLSGGNQQKIVLGKALMTEPTVVMLDEPTRGIDVGAKLEVYELVNRLTEQGKAVVLVSSELPELLGMSDRIVMLYEGKVGGVFAKSEATQERLLAAAMGKETLA